MGWTDERVELLKKLWADGLSASQIAAELGGITRNAVIGKVHRLGLSGRAKSPSSSAPRPRKARSSGHMMRVPRASMRGNTALAYEYEAEPEPELTRSRSSNARLASAHREDLPLAGRRSGSTDFFLWRRYSERYALLLIPQPRRLSTDDRSAA